MGSPQAPLPPALAFVRLCRLSWLTQAGWCVQGEGGVGGECVSAHPPLWPRLSPGHPLCLAAHMELNATCREQTEPILKYDCCCQLHNRRQTPSYLLGSTLF